MCDEIDYEAVIDAAERLLKSESPVERAWGRWTLDDLARFAKPSIFERLMRAPNEKLTGGPSGPSS